LGDRVRRTVVFALFVLAIVGAAPATAQDIWTGPYIGPTYGRGTGEAVYTFNTDGWYNTAPGQTFTQPMVGTPIGGVVGYNWQNGRLVYGLESFFFSHGISAVNSCLVAWPQTAPPCGTPNPFLPNGTADVKGHWFVGLSGRLGVARGGFMAYVQGGVVVGHLVSRLHDNTADIEHWSFGTPLGLTAGAGFELMLGQRWSVGLGYRAIWMAPLHITGVSRDPATFTPLGPATATDHTVQYTAHEIFGRIVFHPGRRDAVDVASRAPFDWPGFSWGVYAGALWQLGIQAGYDWSLGDRYIAGINGQVSFNFCCGAAAEVDLNARAGVTFDDILLYAEVGIGAQTGNFFGVLYGPCYTAGVGIEYAFTQRVSGFVEVKTVRGLTMDVADGNFQAGLNFHRGQ
jgi:outer membrane immunogenic protein